MSPFDFAISVVNGVPDLKGVSEGRLIGFLQAERIDTITWTINRLMDIDCPESLAIIDVILAERTKRIVAKAVPL